MFLYINYFIINLFIIISFLGIIKYRQNLLTVLILIEIVLININVLLLLSVTNFFDINSLIFFLVILILTGIESAIGLTLFILNNRYQNIIKFLFIYADAPVIDFNLNFQNPASSVMEGIINLHHDIFFYLFMICIGVIWVLLNIVFYNSSSSKLYNNLSRPITHHTEIEFFWTLIPALILLSIAGPSMILLFTMDSDGKPELTIHVIGNQWYWNYQFTNGTDFYDEMGYQNKDLPKSIENISVSAFEDMFQLTLEKYPAIYNDFVEHDMTLTDHQKIIIFSDIVEIMDHHFSQVHTIESRMLVESDLKFNDNLKNLVNIEKIEKIEKKQAIKLINIINTFIKDIENIELIENTFFSLPDIYRLLEVDNYLTLPINTNIRFLVSSNDVIHSFAVPSLGIKMDAIPGRVNKLNIIVNREGLYYGQCSEICGVDHAFMPIVFKFKENELSHNLFFGKNIFNYHNQFTVQTYDDTYKLVSTI